MKSVFPPHSLVSWSVGATLHDASQWPVLPSYRWHTLPLHSTQRSLTVSVCPVGNRGQDSHPRKFDHLVSISLQVGSLVVLYVVKYHTWSKSTFRLLKRDARPAWPSQKFHSAPILLGASCCWSVGYFKCQNCAWLWQIEECSVLLKDVKTAAQLWSSCVSNDPWPKPVPLPLDSKTCELLTTHLDWENCLEICDVKRPLHVEEKLSPSCLEKFHNPKSFVVDFITYFSVLCQCDGLNSL